MSNQANKATIGQAFGAILAAIVAAVMFVPRIINGMNKAMDVVDDVLDSGKNLTGTMRQTSEDFKNLSALEGQANYQERLHEINEARQARGLSSVDVASSRNSDAVAEALAALGK